MASGCVGLFSLFALVCLFVQTRRRKHKARGDDINFGTSQRKEQLIFRFFRSYRTHATHAHTRRKMLVLLSVIRSPLHKSSSSFECLLMVFAITMIISCMGRGSVDERDQRLVLEALYDATGGSLWYEGCRCNSYGCWLQEDLPHCNWSRVGCASDWITGGFLPPITLFSRKDVEGNPPKPPSDHP